MTGQQLSIFDTNRGIPREFVIEKAARWAHEIPQTVGGKPFATWLAENFEIWERFCGIADEVWRAGRRHYSGRTIVEVLRHETIVREADSQFKLNNNCAPGLCRLYMHIYPEKTGFFELRNERDSACG